MALADGLRDRGVEAARAAHFLTQLLFCLFAENIGLLPKGLFTAVVRRATERPESFRRNVAALVGAMRGGGEFNLADIAHFDGGMPLSCT